MKIRKKEKLADEHSYNFSHFAFQGRQKECFKFLSVVTQQYGSKMKTRRKIRWIDMFTDAPL